MRRAPAAALLAALMSVASVVAAGRQSAPAWSQWRGADRDGAASAAALPQSLPAALTPVWQVPVGAGHSTPIVADDRVFVFTREGAEEVVRALALADGRELWRADYEAPYTMNPAAQGHGPGPKSTPVSAGGRLFTFGITGVLSAFDAEGGELLWRREFSDRYTETAPIYGTAMSPIVVGDLVVAHVGGNQGGALTAFDVASGEVRWRNEEFHPGYASPILFTVAGPPMLVTQTDEHIVAVDPDDGTTLWRMPFATAFQQNTVTPVAAGPLLVVSGLDLDLFAVELLPAGDTPGEGAWEAREVWRNRQLPAYMSTPVLVGGRLFGMSHKRAGQFFCVDVATGEPIWTSRGREGENASIIALGGRVAFLTDAARLLFVAAEADAYEPLAEYEVASTPTWAHPVFIAGGVLIKDLESLALLGF